MIFNIGLNPKFHNGVPRWHSWLWPTAPAPAHVTPGRWQVSVPVPWETQGMDSLAPDFS